MERSEYERMAAAEERIWWYRALHENLLATLDGLEPGAVVLDAGCGTGGFLKRLATRPAWRVLGIELDRGAAETARGKSKRPIAVASVHRLPVAPGALDAIVSADVLCHDGVEVARALAEFRAALKPGGRVVLSLPAYMWLYSAHDRAVGNARRFTKAEVADLLRGAGFARIAARYWNSLLFPLMLLRRLATRNLPAAQSDVEPLAPPLEALFGTIARVEARLARKGLHLPFGGSILAVAEKT